jgi:hypothetical protein
MPFCSTPPGRGGERASADRRPSVPTASEHRHAQEASRGPWNKWEGPTRGADVASIIEHHACPPRVGGHPFMPRKPLDAFEHGGRLVGVGAKQNEKEYARL